MVIKFQILNNFIKQFGLFLSIQILVLFFVPIMLAQSSNVIISFDFLTPKHSTPSPYLSSAQMLN